MNIIKALFYKIVYLCGSVAHVFSKMQSYYENQKISHQLGGGKTTIQYPFRISGVENIECGESINIGKGSVIMCLRAKLIIKGHFVSGPNLTIITGDHMPVVGRFLDTITDDIKEQVDVNKLYDQNVIIEEDVWAGANVTILKGVTIGRGCILAAGSIVTKSIPPYCVVGGIPARPMKMRWTIEQIMQHESKLYEINNRITKDTLEKVNKLFC